MNKLSEAIEQIKNKCYNYGNSDIKIDQKIKISAKWEESDKNNNFDIVTIYISYDDIIKIRYQLDETAVKR